MTDLNRPQVSVFSSSKKNEVTKQIALPDVFQAPIRTDIVRKIHADVSKNRRQPYAVNRYAGLQTAAESWGTGRAVSRIPRVPGGGTHRAGQGAFGNMCRGGRLFAPTKTWRRWAHKIPKAQKRFATVSAIAASSEIAIVEARGHKISKIAELPLVVSDDIESIAKTKEAMKFLKLVGAGDDIAKSKNSRMVRAGSGKKRNRRYVQKKGPLVIYKKDNGIVKGFRNISGVDLCNVSQLNILSLAPGAHVGRFIIWTESAFNELNNIFGSYGAKGPQSKLNQRSGLTYTLPQAVISNTDISKIIGSDAVQSVVRDRKILKGGKMRKSNPLKNHRHMVRLNPFAQEK